MEFILIRLLWIVNYNSAQIPNLKIGNKDIQQISLLLQGIIILIIDIIL